MSVQLLNPAVESDVCRSMIALATARLGELEKRLTQTTLDREAYIGTIASTLAIRDLATEMQHLYNLRFNK